ncbi:MAG: hypothetical protein ABR578_10430, partial [Chromatocurvus sp.]
PGDKEAFRLRPSAADSAAGRPACGFVGVRAHIAASGATAGVTAAGHNAPQRMEGSRLVY